MKIGLRVKAARKAAGLSIPELYRMIVRATDDAPSEMWLRRLERGEVDPTVSRLRVLADALGTTTGALLGEDPRG